jgi:hypothetical protein
MAPLSAAIEPLGFIRLNPFSRIIGQETDAESGDLHFALRRKRQFWVHFSWRYAAGSREAV